MNGPLEITWAGGSAVLTLPAVMAINAINGQTPVIDQYREVLAL